VRRGEASALSARVAAACRPLRSPLFRRHFTARVLSWTGTALSPVALAFAVLAIGGGPAGMGVIVAAEMGAVLVMLLVGGVVADRVSRTRVLAAANAVAGTGQSVAVFLLVTGRAQVWSLAALAVVGGIASAFSGPASSGLVREVVPGPDLQQANALLRLAQNVVKVGGPAVGGLVVAVAGASWAIAWDAVTYFVAAFLYVGLRLPQGTVRLGPAGMAAQLAEGWREFRTRSWLWLMVAQSMLMVPAWLVAYQALGPVYGQRYLGGAAGWGLVMSGFTAGLLAGAWLALLWRPRRVGWLVCGAAAAMAVPMVSMAAGGGVPGVAAATCLAGAGQSLASTVWAGLVQARVPNAVYGRVNSICTLAQLAPVPVVALVAGHAATAGGLRRTLAVCAAATLLAAGLPLARRRVRALVLPRVQGRDLVRSGR